MIVFCNHNLTVYQDLKAGRLFPEVYKGGPASNSFRKTTLSFAECKQCYISEIMFKRRKSCKLVTKRRILAQCIGTPHFFHLGEKKQNVS